MNSCSVTNCKILPYRTDSDTAYEMGQNEYGKYIKFRIFEKDFGKSKGIVWFCIANRPDLVDFLEKNLHINDEVAVTGHKEMYIDKIRKKESERLIIDQFAFTRMRGKENLSPSKPPEIEKKAEDIDFEMAGIFQSEINVPGTTKEVS